MSSNAAHSILISQAKSSNACVKCSKSLGDAAKVHPTSVLPADGEGKPETWCPTCFVYHRAPLEAGRWVNIVAAKCAACGFETVIHGHGRGCSNCGKPRLVILPPSGVARA